MRSFFLFFVILSERSETKDLNVFKRFFTAFRMTFLLCVIFNYPYKYNVVRSDKIWKDTEKV